MLFNKRLGLFIHWGIYACKGWQEQELGRLGLTNNEYEPYMQQFNPQNYNPDDWIIKAKAAGMSYIVFTAKHHDGFCMWATKETDYNIMNTPYRKDILKELSEACIKHDFPLGIYYSNPDWHHIHAYNPLSSHQMPPLIDNPDFSRYKGFLRNQIIELMTEYNKIACLFWDIPPKLEDIELMDMVRRLQPGILINDRGWGAGDYSTPERELPSCAPYKNNVEANQSVGHQSWGYRVNEDYYSASFLMKSISGYLMRGANYLLNIGPDALGRFPEEADTLLAVIGKWYKNAKEALDSEWMPELGVKGEFQVSKTGNSYYLHFDYPAERTGYAVPFLNEPPVSVVLLNDGRMLKYEIERFPTRHIFYSGKIEPDCLHIMGIPCDSIHEPLKVKISI